MIETDEGVFVAGLNSYGEDGNNGVASYGADDFRTRVSRFISFIEGEVDLPEPAAPVVDAGTPGEVDAGDPPVEEDADGEEEAGPPVDPLEPIVDAGAKVEPDAGPEDVVEPIDEIQAPRMCSDNVVVSSTTPVALLLSFALVAVFGRRARS